MAIVYDIYSNRGVAGAPVDYSAPIATVAGTSYTTGALARGSTYLFGVRARDAVTGLSESNIDTLTVVIDLNGNDVSGRPMAPQHLTVTPIVGGQLRVEWSWPYKSTTGPAPKGFRIYSGLTPGPDYSRAIATIAYRTGQRFFRVTIPGLGSGLTCWVGVRAFNTSGEEPNVVKVSAVPVSQAPRSVGALSITGTSQS